MFTNSTAHVQRKETGVHGSYLVRARAMAQMARVNFVCVTVIICLHSNLNPREPTVTLVIHFQKTCSV